MKKKAGKGLAFRHFSFIFASKSETVEHMTLKRLELLRNVIGGG